MSASPVLFGILVGGQSRRMGGTPKGNLDAGGQPLVARTIALCRALAPAHAAEPVLLVGESREYDVDVPRLADAPAGVGPLGGLCALLQAALERRCRAIALAVDLPHIDAALLGRLIVEHDSALALAPREHGRWQPLCARYRPERVLPIVHALLARGESALQAVFHALGADAVELALSPAERARLHDWDTPEDVLAYPIPGRNDRSRG
jgi:molybdopterin-guanine dinucleotide biosynthesis protein A